jgi:hypothetical protein
MKKVKHWLHLIYDSLIWWLHPFFLFSIFNKYLGPQPWENILSVGANTFKDKNSKLSLESNFLIC